MTARQSTPCTGAHRWRFWTPTSGQCVVCGVVRGLDDVGRNASARAVKGSGSDEQGFGAGWRGRESGQAEGGGAR